jgi:DNA-binding NtrC family response regulator/tetratricopeptide (TPR) repeat protein/class 3 adenylate cyclase
MRQRRKTHVLTQGPFGTRNAPTVAELIGESPGITSVRGQIDRLLRLFAHAHRPPTVLLAGETGTGKGLIARLLHRSGPRATGPFVDVNCAAIPDTLLEAELFGFERGAFTDARQRKLGLFQAADNGVLFLDEIALLPLGLQAKLLKVLEERSIRRIGGTHNIPVDVWIIAATNEDLNEAVRAGRVREDLFHRIAGLTLQLPSLRERQSDICVLAQHFLTESCREYGVAPRRLAPDAIGALESYEWPGNVRELANVIERAVLLSEAHVLTASNLALPTTLDHPSSVRVPEAGLTFRATVDRVEREQLLEALNQTHWNISAAAARLGIPRNTLRYRMNRFALRSAGHASRRRTAADLNLSESPESSTGESIAGVLAPGPRRREQRQVAWLRAALPDLHESAAGFAGRLFESMIEKVEGFGGSVDEISADGLIAVFGLQPVEDAPRRAAHAGLAIQKAVAHAQAMNNARLRLSVGAHVTSAVIEEMNGARQLNVESRRLGREGFAPFNALDCSDDLLASASLARMLDSWFHVEAVSGTESDLQASIYRITGPRRGGLEVGSGGRRRPFVGRDRELGLLRERVDLLASGRGHVVGIIGEPGGGKSRLLYEFGQHLAEKELVYFEGRCLSHGIGTPYVPVLDLLRRCLGVDDSDRPEHVTSIVRQRLAAESMDPDTQAPYLLRLFGVSTGTESLAALSPEAIKRHTFDVVRRLILRPGWAVVLAIEDLHWVDRTSEEFFASVVDSVPGAPILFVSTYRPGYRPPWMDRSYVSQLALDPLSAAESRTLVAAIFPDRGVSASTTDAIVARGEGNPFFLEELALAAISGENPDAKNVVPDSIGEILKARIDRLPGRLRQVLDTSAVLGREVPFRLLDTVLSTPSDLRACLTDLVRFEFLHDQPGAAGSVYGFKHALIQDVTYSRLSETDRNRLHTAAGEALETLYTDRVGEILDRLTYHFARTDKSEKAVAYLVRFGGAATQSYALTEAVVALEQALLHAERLPGAQQRERHVLGLLPHITIPLILLGRLEEARDLLARYRDRVDRLDEPQISGPYYFSCAIAYDHTGDRPRALETVTRSIVEATKAGDEATVRRAHMIASTGNLWAGDFRAGVANGRRAIPTTPEAGEMFWTGMAYWMMAWHHLLLGEFREANEAGDNARRIGEAIDDRRIQSYGTCISGWVALLKGDLATGIERCERAAQLAPDPLALAIVLSTLGWGHTEAGQPGQAKSHLEKAAQLLHQFHMSPLECWALCRLSLAHLMEGNSEEARHLASQALELARNVVFHLGEGLAQRALGRALARDGTSGEAHEHLLAALAIFDHLEARYEMARTHVDLADMARRTGNSATLITHRNEARSLFQSLAVPRWVARTEELS